jgi:26S proteasome regulatory subunit, ATPase 3, interacting protein
MAPSKPKSTNDDASSTTSELPPVLKPKTERAKVTKPKTDKTKTEKAKTEKPKTVKKEKVDDGDGGGKKGDKTASGVKIEKGDGSGGGVGGKKGGDGKEKVKTVNGEEAIELMARYLKEQNRPYSATDVSANLHGKVGFPIPSLSSLFLRELGLIEGNR